MTICAYCGKKFEQTRRDRKFCSDNCRKYHHRDKKREALYPAETRIQLSEIMREAIRHQFLSVKPDEFTARRWREIKRGPEFLSLSELSCLQSFYPWFIPAFRYGDKNGDVARNNEIKRYENRV